MSRTFCSTLCGFALVALVARLGAQVIPPGIYTSPIAGDTINSAVVYVDPGASFVSQTLTLTGSAGVYWRQVGTLAGKTITMGNGAYLFVNGANNAVTLDSTSTVSGDVSIYSDGSANTAITNQGTLTHSVGSGQIYASNFTNAGTITATGGTYLYLGYPSAGYNTTNTGSVTADGSGTFVYLRGNFDNNGTLTAQNSGNLLWDGNNTTANLGNVTISGGRALLNGIFDNTATNLTAPTGGSFELYGGTITGGTIAPGALTFTTSAGYIDGATINGDLNLPTAGSYVRFINGAGFTGPNATFANGAGLYWQQVGTLSGKAITLGNGAYLYVTGANTALTLDSTSTVSGDVSIYSDGSANTAITNQGTLTHSVGSGQIYASTFTNSGTITATGGTYLYLGYPAAGYNTTNTGTITADGANTFVYLRGNFDNNGTLTAQNSGNLLWDGNTTTANLGNVTISGGRALLNGTIDNTSATLTAPTGGSFELYGGTITGGTIASGALTFTSSGGYLSGASITGDLNLPTSGSFVRFINGTDFTGANATFANGTGLYWQQVGTLSGKAITLGNGAYLYVTGANTALTLDSTSTVSGDVSIYSDGSANTAITTEGTLTHSVGSGQIYASTFTNTGAITATGGNYLYLGYPGAGYNSTNTGTVTADGSGTFVYLRGNFDNNGTLTAQNSANLLWDGNNTTANLGNVTISGGRALLYGTINNTSDTLTAPSGGMFELYGGTITGGTIASGALGFTSSGGYLSGAALTGDLAVGPSAHVRLTNNASFTGTNVSLANSAGLYWQQGGTLTGHSLALGNGAYVYVQGVGNNLTLNSSTVTTGSGAYIHLSGANTSLTLDSATTITGGVSLYSDGNAGTAITNQGTLTHNIGSGSIYATSFTNAGTITATGGTYLYLNYPSAGYNATNTGTVTADGSGTFVYLRGNFDNNGTLTAQNSGNLIWDGNNTTANLGNVTLTGGGRALLNGIIDNTSTTLSAPTGGSFELYGGTITGGTIAAGALGFTTSAGSLNGTTLTGDLNLATASSYVRFLNGTTFTGANATFANGAHLRWQQSGTFVGKTITTGSGAYMYLEGANRSLTLDAATTVTGHVSIYTDNSAGTTITNHGALTHNINNTGYLFADSFTNSGTIAVTTGTLYLGYYSDDSTTNAAGGVITLSAGNVHVYSPLSNAGQFNVQGGILYTNDKLTNAPGGLLTGAGTINGALTMAGGTLAPGNSIGTLTFASGSDLIVSGASTLEIELNATSADKLVFQNPGTIDLGAGLLQISLVLLSTPTPNASYTLLDITSGGSGYTGFLAGLPNNGDQFVATFAGDPYTFHVSYLTNQVVFHAVPEPGTYALMGAGLLVLALLHRRRSRK